MGGGDGIFRVHCVAFMFMFVYACIRIDIPFRPCIEIKIKSRTKTESANPPNRPTAQTKSDFLQRPNIKLGEWLYQMVTRTRKREVRTQENPRFKGASKSKHENGECRMIMTH